MDFVVLISNDIPPAGSIVFPEQHAVERFVPIPGDGPHHERSIHLPGHFGDNFRGIREAQGVNIRGIFWPYDNIDIGAKQRCGHSVVIGEVVSPVVVGKQSGISVSLHCQHTD